MVRVERVRRGRIFYVDSQSGANTGRHVMREVIAPVRNGAALMRCPDEDEDRYREEYGIDMRLSVCDPCGSREHAEHEPDAECDRSSHVTGDGWARVASAVSQHIAESESGEGCGERSAKDEVGSFAQRGTLRRGDFQNWKQNDETNGDVEQHRMKAAEELQPVCVRASVEP